MNTEIFSEAKANEMLTVAIVDDDHNSRERVKNMLVGSDNCFQCKEFDSPEALFDAPLESIDLLIFDEFFNETRDRRAAELVQYALENFPGVPIIIFSDYPDPTSIARSESVAAFIDKLRANQDPSIFRTEISRAIRYSTRLTPGQISSATDCLSKQDSEQCANEEQISDITLDNVIYPFVGALVIGERWTDALAECSLYIKQYPELVQGKGPDYGSARRSLYGRFHEKFQKIFTQAPIYDSEVEKADRQTLSDIVDIEKYQGLRTVYVPNWFGRIRKVDIDGTRHVAWWEGPRTAHRIDEVPTLANLEVDDWIRAAIEKRLATGAIVRVLNVVRTNEPKYSADARNAFWNK